MRSSFIVATTTALLAAGLIACNDNPEPEYPEGGAGAAYPQGGYGAQTPYQQGGYGAQTPVPAPTNTAPQPAAGGTATPIPPAMAAVAAPLLKEMAKRETAGMREDGPPMAANFQQGQIYEHTFQVQPGRCYTMVGVGFGMTELDMELVLHQPPAPEWIAAQDNSTGAQAVIGGGGQCFKNPLPIGAPAKLRIRSTAGGGVVMAQVYSK